MQVFRGFHHPGIAPACALVIGNFDGVHRGHQAMLALLVSEARHRGVPSCAVTFEPHPRDWFARLAGKPASAPPRISTLRDKLSELQRCGVDQVIVLRFDAALAAYSPDEFVQRVIVDGLGARYVLVGDDFRYGARRAGDYATLDAAGRQHGFDVARMMSYEVHGERVSSSAVRQALHVGDMQRVAELLGRHYSISAHVIHGAKLGRELGFRTLNLKFGSARPAAMGIFVVRAHGVVPDRGLIGVASLGVRPTVQDAGRVLLETHCLEWPDSLGMDGGYGRCIRVELLKKLHDERKYASLDALRDGIEQDVVDARAWFAQERASASGSDASVTGAPGAPPPKP